MPIEVEHDIANLDYWDRIRLQRKPEDVWHRMNMNERIAADDTHHRIAVAEMLSEIHAMLHKLTFDADGKLRK